MLSRVLLLQFVCEKIFLRTKKTSPTDCGFGREGLSRRIAFYKCVALVEGTNIVRHELGLPEARVRAADPTLWFASR